MTAGLPGGPASIVLVVDDSPGTLGMLNTALEAAGYTVLLAQSGAAALALMERVTPDIVLMDAVMPGMDGFEACARLKRSRMNAGVPVVFMTGRYLLAMDRRGNLVWSTPQAGVWLGIGEGPTEAAPARALPDAVVA